MLLSERAEALREEADDMVAVPTDDTIATDAVVMDTSDYNSAFFESPVTEGNLT